MWFAIAPAWAVEPADSVAHALQQIEAKRYGLARSYLDTVVIDARLSGVQRARAYYYRGYAFLAEGLYVSAAQDYERALELDPGNSTVLAELGRLYANGDGVDKNTATAFKLFLKAARGGNDTARLYVGYALLTGSATPPTFLRRATGCASPPMPGTSMRWCNSRAAIAYRSPTHLTSIKRSHCINSRSTRARSKH